jgi:hypothetical protein
MTRNHRTAHRFFWPALGVVVAFALLMALVLRAPPAQGAPPAPALETVR